MESAIAEKEEIVAGGGAFPETVSQMKSKVGSGRLPRATGLLSSPTSKRFFGRFVVLKRFIDYPMVLIVPRLRYRPSLGIGLTRG